MTVKIILDTDGITDDIKALSLALSHPDAQVIAVTTVHGITSVKHATANVIRTLRATGKTVPVYKGCENPFFQRETWDLKFFFGEDGISGLPDNFPKVEPSDFTSHEKEPAALALIRLTKEHPDATLVCTGPLTNVAVAIKLDPNFAKQVSKLVIMGGNYYGIGNVSSNTSAEFNFHCDPEAAHIVLKEMKCPITIVPLELFELEGDEHQKKTDFEAHLKYQTPIADYLRTVTSGPRAYVNKDGRQSAYCDEIAVAAAIDIDRIAKKTKELRVTVELAGKYTRGQVMVNWVSKSWLETIGKQGHGNENPGRLVTFVTSYDAHLLDKWMHNTCSGNWTQY